MFSTFNIFKKFSSDRADINHSTLLKTLVFFATHIEAANNFSSPNEINNVTNTTAAANHTTSIDWESVGIAVGALGGMVCLIAGLLLCSCWPLIKKDENNLTATVYPSPSIISLPKVLTPDERLTTKSESDESKPKPKPKPKPESESEESSSIVIHPNNTLPVSVSSSSEEAQDPVQNGGPNEQSQQNSQDLFSYPAVVIEQPIVEEQKGLQPSW